MMGWMDTKSDAGRCVGEGLRRSPSSSGYIIHANSIQMNPFITACRNTVMVVRWVNGKVWSYVVEWKDGKQASKQGIHPIYRTHLDGFLVSPPPGRMNGHSPARKEEREGDHQIDRHSHIILMMIVTPRETWSPDWLGDGPS